MDSQSVGALVVALAAAAGTGWSVRQGLRWNRAENAADQIDESASVQAVYLEGVKATMDRQRGLLDDLASQLQQAMDRHAKCEDRLDVAEQRIAVLERTVNGGNR